MTYTISLTLLEEIAASFVVDIITQIHEQVPLILIGIYEVCHT